MARRKREPMSEGKKNIIGMLLEEYDIKTAKDIEEALKDLLGGTIQEMLESEMDEHLGYQEYERSDNPDYRNGKKTKKIRGNFGETEIEVPQDRDGSFEPKVVKKRQKDISGIEQKIIALYAKGMTTRQISETIEDIYGFEVSDGMVSDITDRLLPQIEDWQKRPLDEVYPIVFIDAVHFSVRDNGQIRKLLAIAIVRIVGTLIFLISQMFVHFRLKHFLDRPSEKVFVSFFNTLCRLDVVFLKQHSYDILLAIINQPPVILILFYHSLLIFYSLFFGGS